MEHTLSVKNRQSCTITGVRELISSNEKEIVVIITNDSFLMIKGKNLKIRSYQSDSITIEGITDSFTYSKIKK